MKLGEEEQLDCRVCLLVVQCPEAELCLYCGCLGKLLIMWVEVISVGVRFCWAVLEIGLRERIFG